MSRHRTASFSGTCDELSAYASNVFIDGTVNGDVNVGAQNVTVGKSAKIFGAPHVSSSQDNDVTTERFGVVASGIGGALMVFCTMVGTGVIGAVAGCLASMLAATTLVRGGFAGASLSKLAFPMLGQYVSALVGGVIIAAGASSLNSAIGAISIGVTSTYSTTALIIIGIASVTKGVLGLYTRSAGKRLGSSPLVANGTDSLLNSIVSASTLVAAIINITFDVAIESYLAAIISLPIIKSGIVLTDYGPSHRGGSLRVIVNANMTISEFDEIAREVHRRVMKECGVNLISVGVYPAKKPDDASRKWRAKMARLLWRHEHVVEVRGFYLDMEQKACRFDAAADYSVKDAYAPKNELRVICEEALPGYEIEPRADRHRRLTPGM